GDLSVAWWTNCASSRSGTRTGSSAIDTCSSTLLLRRKPSLMPSTEWRKPMIRAVKLSCLAAAFAMFGLATACSDPQSPKANASLLPWGGTIAVVNTTAGSDPDPNGYEVWVDDSYSQSPGSNGVSYFNGLSQGDHKVSLIMVAANCLVTATVNGVTAVDNPRNVSISAAETATTNFDVGCAS